ncbi:MAG: hypothetical protein ABI114_13950 [Rhodanobacter sp.]
MTDQTAGKVPQIRFKGFEGVWEEEPILSRIKNVIDFRGRTPKKLGLEWSPSGYLALSALNVKDGYIDRYADAHYGDESLYRKWMAGNELHCNQVLFTTEAPMGNVAQIPDKQKYILSQRTIAFVTDVDRLSEDYLGVLLKSPNVFGSLLARSSGGTAKGVSQKSLSSIYACVSDDLIEQTQIGKYFRELHRLIGLHQRKHDKLVTLKKAMLQKMFPEPGTTTPKIRFKHFSGEWLETKLGGVGQTQSGIGFPDAEQGGKTGTPFFKISDMSRVGNEQEMITSNNYVSESQLKRKKWMPISHVPAVIFAKVGAAIMLNRKRMVRSPFMIDNNAMAYLFDATWDTNFGRTLFDTINLPLYAQVGALPSYNGSDIKSIVVHRPDNLEEQRKIGTYFRTLDTLISQHATQLQKLKQLKSACLQKMFV